MNKIQIKNRYTNSIIFEYEKENNTLKDTVEQAVKENVNLEGADLTEANLTEANLRGAYLKGAYLTEANLEGADLVEANLEGACLTGANLTGANLRGVNLREAYLRGAYIYLSDSEINKDNIIEDFEKQNNIKIKEAYINKNIIPTKWSCFWKYGLIICDWEIKEKEDTTEKNKEIEELEDKFITDLVDTDRAICDKINEIIRDRNNRNKESEAK